MEGNALSTVTTNSVFEYRLAVAALLLKGLLQTQPTPVGCIVPLRTGACQNPFITPAFVLPVIAGIHCLPLPISKLVFNHLVQISMREWLPPVIPAIHEASDYLVAADRRFTLAALFEVRPSCRRSLLARRIEERLAIAAPGRNGAKVVCKWERESQESIPANLLNQYCHKSAQLTEVLDDR